MNLDDKLAHLQNTLRSYGRVAIAFSGGVDSTLLLKVAVETLGRENVLAVIADSPSMPRSEKRDAEALAATIGAPVVITKSNEFSDKNYVANPTDRCYFCKHALFVEVRKEAESRGIKHWCDGQNVDDKGDWRPGARAVRESGAHSPLAEAGLTKEEIRALSARYGLATATKPAMACLASRIPYGTPVTEETLAQIEAAERALLDLGFALVRVRHHGEVARIEVGASELARFLDPELRHAVTTALKAAGYTYVTLDIEGYRSGSLNAKLQDKQ